MCSRFGVPWGTLTRKRAVCLWAQSYVGHGWYHIAKWSHKPFLNQRRDIPLAAWPLLETINMGSCGLYSMSMENVTGLTELRSLLLKSNKLTVIPNLSFMSKLENISLQHNQLTCVPDMYDLPLRKLKLAGNPLVCNKSLCWIRVWPWMKTSTIPSDEPNCAAPFEMAGIKLMEIDPAEMECYRGGWKR